jgi:hypothetical protein
MQDRKMLHNKMFLSLIFLSAHRELAASWQLCVEPALLCVEREPRIRKNDRG